MTTQEVKRKLAAILSTDVKGYSRLLGEDELGTIRTLHAHKGLMSELILRHRGRVVDAPGDNLLAEFGSVVDAVQCAVEIQKELGIKNSALPENRRMEFRIGVNLGDVVEEEEKLYGDGVNIAARLEGLAEAGGVCISGTAFDQVRNKLNLGYEFRGEQAVKNIAEPVRVYKVLTDPQSAGKVIGERKAPHVTSESLDAHYDAIIKTIVEGRVVAFLGEGANLCGRPSDKKWAYHGSDTLPSSSRTGRAPRPELRISPERAPRPRPCLPVRLGGKWLGSPL